MMSVMMSRPGRPKRPHGSGSVRWRSGAWSVQVYGGRGEDGRPRYESRTVHAPNTAAGRRKAERVARELYDQIQHRAGEPGTLGDYLDRWIEHRRDHWPEGEARRNHQTLAGRVLPSLGRISLERLTTLDIDTCYTRLRRRGLSAGSIRRTHALLHAALEQAVKWQLIGVNPAHAATLLRSNPLPPSKLPAPNQLHAVIDSSPPWFGAFVRLGLHTGARTGELARLRWDDIDLDDGVVRLWQGKTRKWKVLALGERTGAVMAGWHQATSQHSLERFGEPMLADWWVFTTPRRPERPVSVSQVGHAWEWRRDQAGLAGVPFKALRKTMATVLLSGGHDLRTVMGRGGWSAAAAGAGSSTVMLTHYAQFVTEADRRAAQTMDAWLDGA